MQPNASPAAGRRSRDQRLDVVRGLTMLIIFVAHVPENPWRDWIPARFGFSSGTELFVFCSGVASALAFGSIFVARGMALGTARIAYRCWQVYWAHIGLLFASITVDALVDSATGGNAAIARQFGPLLTDPVGAVVGAMTLTWLPEYLDILPMYLVILALVPVVMWARRLHPALPFAVVLGLYATVWTRGLELSGNPWTHDGWFLNPFAWQLVFFTGFFACMGWLPVPPLRNRMLVTACTVFLVASIPVNFWAVLNASETALAINVFLQPLNAKADLHVLRFLHFLALAYVALSLVDPYRDRLADRLPGSVLVVVGRQSLGTFLVSLVLARLAGSILDVVGRQPLPVAAVNLAGLALIVVAAVVIGWFKSAPWAKARHAATWRAAPADPMAASEPGMGSASKTAAGA